MAKVKIRAKRHSQLKFIETKYFQSIYSLLYSTRNFKLDLNFSNFINNTYRCFNLSKSTTTQQWTIKLFDKSTRKINDTREKKGFATYESNLLHPDFSSV